MVCRRLWIEGEVVKHSDDSLVWLMSMGVEIIMH